jgi:hypothetical protein
LDSDDSSDSVFNTSTRTSVPNEKPAPANQDNEPLIFNKQNVMPSAPPIYISNITNFSAFAKQLIRLTRPNAFTCKSTTSFLIIHAKGVQNYNTIMNHLRDTGACYHTCQPSVYRSFRVIIKNFNHSIFCTEISDALSEEGHFLKQVINVKNKNKRGLSLFFVDLILIFDLILS